MTLLITQNDYFPCLYIPWVMNYSLGLMTLFYLEVNCMSEIKGGKTENSDLDLDSWQ